MDEQRLETLIFELCQSELGSNHRRKCFSRLIISIQQHPRLYRSCHEDYPEAQNLTWEWAFRNIDAFEPRSSSTVDSFLVWLNGYLKWRVRDLFAPDSKYLPETSLDQPIIGPEDPVTLGDLLPGRFRNDVDDLIEKAQQEQRHRLGEAIWDYIEHDPEHKLKQCCPRKQPQCHGQLLAMRLLLQDPPQHIRDIAREFEISDQTLYSHWKRKCIPLLQSIAQSIAHHSGEV